MTNKVFIAASIDGYIAKEDGDLSWLMEQGMPTGSDGGFSAFISSIDGIVMGRNTYEKILSFEGEWPYAKQVFVLSNNLKELDPKVQKKAEVVNGKLSEVVDELSKKGFKDLYIDGGVTIQNFLKEELIDEITITRIPILLGGGISLFSELSNPQLLKHASTVVFDNGFVQSRYLL